MKTIDHSPGIIEPVFPEIESPVIIRPIIVYHHYTRWETIIDNGTGIIQNIPLVLVLNQLYPGIVLRSAKQQGIRQLVF